MDCTPERTLLMPDTEADIHVVWVMRCGSKSSRSEWTDCHGTALLSENLVQSRETPTQESTNSLASKRQQEFNDRFLVVMS